MRWALGLVALAVLLVPPPAAAPHVGGTSLGPAVILTGGCPPGVNVTCNFAAQPFGPALLFYRFDFGADGTWEFPDQTGAGDFGRWTTGTSVSLFRETPPARSCVQAWDGVSVRMDEGVAVPRGPVGCTDFVDFIPSQWSRFSRGRWVGVVLERPAWLDPDDFGRLSEVEGIRALPGSFGGGPDNVFRVSRPVLTALLGPGTHTVHFTITWAGSTFTATSTVTIL